MKERKALSHILGSQQASDPASLTGNSVSWSTLGQQVTRMQKQISQASQRGDSQTVHTLQQRLLESEAARLLAVRRVTQESQGKDTAGVDGVKSLTSQERLAMASTIHPRHWQNQSPLPVRRVWIPKPGTTERRPLAILAMIDRCKQALVKLALEPEWEGKFEPHSYGFRPGRSTHDAIAAILVAMERSPCFVFDADIERAFEHVNQVVVLDKLHTFPALKRVINAWLTVDVMDGNMCVPSKTGIAQGGVLSPLLMNITLHGMEAVVTQSATNTHGRERPLLVRYADDFVIMHSDLQELQQATRRVRQWLATLGLHLHARKTRITHTMTPYQGQVGFDFLGFYIFQKPETPVSTRKGAQTPPRHGRTIVTPSQEASQRHLTAIDQRLRQVRAASQAQVITELNPLIRGWANYYAGLVESATMSYYDDVLEQRLLLWASWQHPGKTHDWLLARYWRSGGKQRAIFATHDGVRLHTHQHSDILKG